MNGPSSYGRSWALIGLAAAVCLPGIVLRYGGIHPEPVPGAIIFGLAILAAAFLLSWGAETAELDISQGLALAIIAKAYCEEQKADVNGKIETRTVLRFHPRVAPVKCGIFPLLKNKPELVKKAEEVVALLRPHMAVFYDESGAIGRRYRRQDEIGTPFGVTIDFETLEGPQTNTVTLRHRDTMQQERIAIAELLPRLSAAIR